MRKRVTLKLSKDKISILKKQAKDRGISVANFIVNQCLDHEAKQKEWEDSYKKHVSKLDTNI